MIPSRAIDFDDMRMIDRGGDGRLLLKLGHKLRVLTVRLLQEFQSDQAVQIVSSAR